MEQSKPTDGENQQVLENESKQLQTQQPQQLPQQQQPTPKTHLSMETDKETQQQQLTKDSKHNQGQPHESEIPSQQQSQQESTDDILVAPLARRVSATKNGTPIHKTVTPSHISQPDQEISLLNFGDFQVIDSPRSLKALKHLGIDQSELQPISRMQIYQAGIPVEFRDDVDFYVNVKADHLERKRKELVARAIKERDTIDESSEIVNNSQMRHEDTLKEYQRKQMLKLQQINRNEIEKFIQTEMKIAQLKQRQESKEAKIKQLERRKAEDQMVRQRYNLEIQNQRGERLNVVGLSRNQEQERSFQKMEQDTKRWQAKKQQMELERAYKNRLTEQQRQSKLTKISAKLEKHTSSRVMDNEIRTKQFGDKIRKIEEMQHMRQLSMQQKNSESQLHMQRKLQEQYENRKRQHDESLERMRSKQEEIESRLHDLESQKRNEQLEKQHQFIVRLGEIKQKQDLLEYSRMQHLSRSQQRVLENSKRNQSVLLEMSLSKQRRIEQKRQREQEATEKSRLLEQEQKAKNDERLDTLQESIARAEQTRQQHLLEIKRKYIIEHLQIEEAICKQQRLERVNDDKKQRVMSRLQLSAEKLEQVKEEQVIMRKQRREFQLKLDAEKERVLQKFEQKRREAYLKQDYSILQSFESKSSLSNSFYLTSSGKKDTGKRMLSARRPSEPKTTQHGSLPIIEQSQADRSGTSPQKNYRYKKEMQIAPSSESDFSYQYHRSVKVSPNKLDNSHISDPTQKAIRVYKSGRTVHLNATNQDFYNPQPYKSRPNQSPLKVVEIKPSDDIEEIPNEQLYKARLKFIKPIYSKSELRINKRSQRAYAHEIYELLTLELTPQMSLDDPSVQNNLSYKLLNLYRKQELNQSKIFRHQNHLNLFDDQMLF